MTDGLVVVKNGKQIKVAYMQRSDSYPDDEKGSFCATAFEIFKRGGDMTMAADEAFGNEEYVERIDGLTVENYVRTKKSEDRHFVDYAYEIDDIKDTFTIYSCGCKVISFTREQLPYAEYAVASYYDIGRAYGFDFDKLVSNLCRVGVKVFAKKMKDGVSVEDIRAEVASILASIRVEINEYAMSEFNTKNEIYAVKVFRGGETKTLHFILDYEDFRKNGKKYEILLQMPHCRTYIDTIPRSWQGAKKRLVGLCRENATALFDLAMLLHKYKTLYNDFSAFTKLPESEQHEQIAAWCENACGLYRDATKTPVAFHISEKSLAANLYSRVDRYANTELAKKSA